MKKIKILNLILGTFLFLQIFSSCNTPDLEYETSTQDTGIGIDFIKPVIDIYGTYSPDGNKIAFYRDTIFTMNDETFKFRLRVGLYIMNADGSNVTQLDTGYISSLKFSPDNKKIAYSREGEIRILDLQSGKKKNYQTKFGPSYFLDWSPDGKSLVIDWMDKINSKGFSLATIDSDLNDSSFRRLSPVWNGDIRFPVFGKDGNTVYALKSVAAGRAITKTNLSTLKTITLATDDINSRHLNINSVGDKLIYSVQKMTMRSTIRNLNGTFLQNLSVEAYSPAFHPNGNIILITSPDSINSGVGARLATYNLITKERKFIKYF